MIPRMQGDVYEYPHSLHSDGSKDERCLVSLLQWILLAA
jgi:hypothetical protein